MLKQRWSLLLALLGLFLLIGTITGAALIDRYLSNPVLVSFNDPAGALLKGTYHPGTQPSGVLLLEGFGSDQVTMTSLASEFARSGWHVFTFDFSGHGRSPGVLTFDNAQTDRLARQVTSALDIFQKTSGLNADQIFVVGHSLGARVALQCATMNLETAAGLVLLGAQVNLSTNVQSEFFTGITDTDLPWVQSLGPQNPPLPILLISGEWDDILTPANARQLHAQLSGENSTGANQAVGSLTSLARDLVILPALVHNYEPFSPRVVRAMQGWLEETSGAVLVNSPAPAIRLLIWAAGLAGMFLLLVSGERLACLGQQPESQSGPLALINLRRFLLGKLLLWLAAVPLAAVLGSIFFFFPMGKPVFNLIYVSFIGGYGILMLVLYRREKVPGMRGRLRIGANCLAGLLKDWKRGLLVSGIVIAALVLTAAYARTGWFYVFPANVRLAWLVIFTPFTALGFWIGLQETQALPGRRGPQTALALVGLFPFFLYTILMAAIGSLSGMIGGMQGLVVLGIVLAFGSLTQTASRCAWLAAVSMAVLLYWLILPQGVLF